MKITEMQSQEKMEDNFTDTKCYRRQEMRHYVGNCQSSTANAHTWSQSLHVGLTMTQTTTKTPETDIINPNCILFDTCYTIRSVINRDLIQEIRACDTNK